MILWSKSFFLLLSFAPIGDTSTSFLMLASSLLGVKALLSENFYFLDRSSKLKSLGLYLFSIGLYLSVTEGSSINSSSVYLYTFFLLDRCLALSWETGWKYVPWGCSEDILLLRLLIVIKANMIWGGNASYSLSKTIILVCWAPALQACTSSRCPQSARFVIECSWSMRSWLLSSDLWACSLQTQSCSEVPLSSHLPLICARSDFPPAVLLSSQHSTWSSLANATAQISGISTFRGFRSLSWYHS